MPPVEPLARVHQVDGPTRAMVRTVAHRLTLRVLLPCLSPAGRASPGWIANNPRPVQPLEFHLSGKRQVPAMQATKVFPFTVSTGPQKTSRWNLASRFSTAQGARKELSGLQDRQATLRGGKSATARRAAFMAPRRQRLIMSAYLTSLRPWNFAGRARSRRSNSLAGWRIRVFLLFRFPGTPKKQSPEA